MLAERCRKAGMPFVIGACQPDPSIMLNRVRRAASLQPAAIQVILPDWWPVTNEEAIDFLNRASDTANGIPLDPLQSAPCKACPFAAGTRHHSCQHAQALSA